MALSTDKVLSYSCVADETAKLNRRAITLQNSLHNRSQGVNLRHGGHSREARLAPHYSDSLLGMCKRPVVCVVSRRSSILCHMVRECARESGEGAEATGEGSEEKESRKSAEFQKSTNSTQGLVEAYKYAYNDAKFVNERARNDIVLLSRGLLHLDARARQDVAILGSGFLKLDARAREDTEKIDYNMKKKAERLRHFATILKDKAECRLKTAADRHWNDGALEADLRRADLRAKKRAMEDTLMALEFIKDIHDIMVSKVYNSPLDKKYGPGSTNIMLEKNGKALDFFPGEVSNDRITAIEEAYWRMAAALSEADGIDYTDPEELELLITTLIDLDAMDGKSSALLLAECSSSPDVSTRQALANALAAAPSMWTLGNAGMGALQRLAEDSDPAVAAAASRAIYELKQQWEIEEGDSWRFTLEQNTFEGSFYLRETADEDSNEDEEAEKSKENADDNEREVEEGHDEETKIRMVQEDEVAVIESENITDKKKIDISIKEGETYPIERIDHLLLLSENKVLLENESLHGSLVCGMECEHDAFHTIQSLKSNLETEQKAKNDLYAELEAERNAAAIAANQTMAMITRLQEEKAAIEMEALQYQRVMEEQAEYDHEALRLLNELVQKREREKEELEKELNVYRERVAEYEVKEKAIMMVGKCVDNDSESISDDLNHEYNKEDKDNCLIECSKEWGELEDSLQELEEERLSIIKQLKHLEEKLYESEKEEMIDPNADLCSQEVNLVPCCFSTDATSETQPKTMASVARRLLDLVDSDDGETEEEAMISKSEMSNGSEKLAIVKEMDHVYGRLHALEADTEFLRHCIGSVSKGNEGTNLLQEILQHLKELRSAEVCF